MLKKSSSSKDEAPTEIEPIDHEKFDDPGLTLAQVSTLQTKFGSNTLQTESHRAVAIIDFLSRFKNPLIIILLAAATLSFFLGDHTSFFIITSMVVLSVGLDFVNTFRSQKAADALKNKVKIKAQVIRAGVEHQVDIAELVPGDIVILDAGKIVPADGVIVHSKDLFTNESALTGESFPQPKPTDAEVFMGSGVISGRGYMRVTKIGGSTKFASIAKALQSSRRTTEFERDIKDFSMLIIRLTFFLVAFVFLVNVVFQRNMLESILFSLALAVGLTPEMLPLIITINLTKGSLRMAKAGVIVKQLSAIQNFGSMDILCTDKTGTLTEDKIALIKHVDGKGSVSPTTLQYGFLASSFSTSFRNPLDQAVIHFPGVKADKYNKIDEIPFDFERKRQSVVVTQAGHKQRYLITEGAPEEIFKIITHYGKRDTKLTPALLKTIKKTYDNLSQDGFRVLAVATRRVPSAEDYTPAIERELTFIGFLAFLDPAKASVSYTLERLQTLGVSIKIITGDNGLVTQKITNDIGLAVDGIITGEQIEKLNHAGLLRAVEQNTVFSRVNPEQKMQIIQALQANGHVVGYMGDGINDAPSLRTADVGVSVNNATDVAKDAADFILLRKSLHELANGVIEGRKTFANTMKYLRMALSSNFGNMFSMAGASIFLPFLPMLATQILLNNFLYDTSQFAIPLDNVDELDILKPHTLNLREIKRFMWSFGLLSSIFDFMTFGVLLFVFHAGEPLFQAGWFLESILTQVLVVFIIRTRLRPFRDSRPSVALTLSTIAIAGLAVFLVLEMATVFSFARLSLVQILTLAGIVAVYLACAELVKQRFYARLGSTAGS